MITARFEEYEFYDILTDEEKVRIMCITNLGTWHTEVKMDSGAMMRSARQKFKEAVMQDMQYGKPPSEIWLQQ